MCSNKETLTERFLFAYLAPAHAISNAPVTSALVTVVAVIGIIVANTLLTKLGVACVPGSTSETEQWRTG